MAIEDDVQTLLEWMQRVIDNARETHEFVPIGDLTDSTLIRLAKDGQSYQITVGDLKRQIPNIEPLPENPTDADDGIYYELDNGNITIYIVDDGSVFNLENRIIPGTYIDETHFIPDHGPMNLQEGYLYVDGGNWYRWNGNELVSFANQNIANSNLTLDANRTLSLDEKTLTIDGTTYGLIIDDGVVRLKNGDNNLTLDVSGINDSHTQEFQDKDGTIALLSDLQDIDLSEYPKKDDNETITGEWEFTKSPKVPEGTNEDDAVNVGQLDDYVKKDELDTEVHHDDTDTVELSGTGEENDPLEAEAKISETSGNILDSDSTGLYVTDDLSQYDNSDSKFTNEDYVDEFGKGLSIDTNDSKLSLKDKDGNTLSTVDLSFLAAGGLDVSIDDTVSPPDLVFKQGGVEVARVSTADLLSGVIRDLDIVDGKLIGYDSQNNEVSSVTLPVVETKDSDSIEFSGDGTDGDELTANVKLSSDADNIAQIKGSGNTGLKVTDDLSQYDNSNSGFLTDAELGDYLSIGDPDEQAPLQNSGIGKDSDNFGTSLTYVTGHNDNNAERGIILTGKNSGGNGAQMNIGYNDGLWVRGISRNIPNQWVEIASKQWVIDNGGISEINTDESLYYDESENILRSNIGTSKEVFNYTGGSQIFTLIDEPSDVLLVSVNGKILNPLTQFTIDSESKKITIEDELTGTTQNPEVVFVLYNFIITQ